MTTPSLTSKIETAFLTVLQAAQTAGAIDSSIEIVRGSTASEPSVPWLAVSCSDPRPAPDMPPQTLVKEADVVLHLRVQADDEDLATKDARIGQILSALGDLQALTVTLNAPASGTDTRPVQDITFYEIFEGSQTERPSENHWETQLVYNLTVQNGDPGKSY
jgi:hypothetical protein